MIHAEVCSGVSGVFRDGVHAEVRNVFHSVVQWVSRWGSVVAMGLTVEFEHCATSVLTKEFEASFTLCFWVLI